MRIGIIGSGNMGRALGVCAAALGHEVCFGARDPAAAESPPISPGQVPPLAATTRQPHSATC